MKRLVKRFGKLITASFFVMAAGIILFLLTIPLYANFGIDTDIIGVLVFTTGLAICITGIILRNKFRGWKLVSLAVLAVLLLLPLFQLIISSIYYLITGKPMGG